MIAVERATAPFAPGFLAHIADLQARSYAPTGIRSWSAAEIATLLENPAIRLYVASQDGEIAGFILIGTIIDEIEILSIAVENGMRRRGIASLLVESVANTVISVQPARVILEVAEHNIPAQLLYKSLRFDPVGRREGYYRINGQKVAAIVMSRS